jgi:hypothetical protein
VVFIVGSFSWASCGGAESAVASEKSSQLKWIFVHKPTQSCKWCSEMYNSQLLRFSQEIFKI